MRSSRLVKVFARAGETKLADITAKSVTIARARVEHGGRVAFRSLLARERDASDLAASHEGARATSDRAWGRRRNSTRSPRAPPARGTSPGRARTMGARFGPATRGSASKCSRRAARARVGTGAVIAGHPTRGSGGVERRGRRLAAELRRFANGSSRSREGPGRERRRGSARTQKIASAFSVGRE